MEQSNAIDTFSPMLKTPTVTLPGTGNSSCGTKFKTQVS